MRRVAPVRGVGPPDTSQRTAGDSELRRVRSAILTSSASNFCGQCGARVPPEANYCRECGVPVKWVPADPVAPVDAEPRFFDPDRYAPDARASTGSGIPGELASMGSRTGAWAIGTFGVALITSIPFIGWIVSLAAPLWDVFLYRRGQNIGARLVGLRIVRDTGELAGFYHVWTRTLASIISLLVFGAGFWTAYSDRDRQTWHDKMLRTYVIADSPEVRDMPASSSDAAKIWFWISVPIIVIAVIAAPALFID